MDACKGELHVAWHNDLRSWAQFAHAITPQDPVDNAPVQRAVLFYIATGARCLPRKAWKPLLGPDLRSCGSVVVGWAKRSVPTTAEPGGHGAKTAPLPTLQVIAVDRNPLYFAGCLLKCRKSGGGWPSLAGISRPSPPSM